MEFLDPKQHRAHLIRLFIGYVLIAIALVLTTIILLYQARGFGFKDGEVIQNGLIFISSQPNPAEIYVNGEKHKEQTNVRLLMPAGQYSFELKREGYRSWKRAINVEGGTVARFDYPILFPSKLTTETVQAYDTKPLLFTQSPDRHWLLVQTGASFANFSLYDLTRPDQAPLNLALPQGMIETSGTHQWKVVEWASDNQHVLLQHLATNNGVQTSEYIVLDRESTQNTHNLTDAFGFSPDKVELRGQKFDQYFVYRQQERVLTTASLDQPQPQTFANDVLAFKTAGADRVLYVTDQGAASGKVAIKLQEGDNTYVVRQVAAGPSYLLDLARYDGAWYIVAGAPSENRTYVYKDPAEKLRSRPDDPLVPVQVFKLANPTFASVSKNFRFMMTQAGQQIAMYDAETDKGYVYTLQKPLDMPTGHVEWLDGFRMVYASSGTSVVFDFDNANQETLVASDATYLPVFDPDFETFYTLAPQTAADSQDVVTARSILSATSLRTAADRE